MAFSPDERLQFAKWYLGNEIWDQFMELNGRKISMPKMDKIRNPNAFVTSLLREFLRDKHPEINQDVLFTSIETSIMEARDERSQSQNAERMQQKEMAKMTESQRRDDTMVNSTKSPKQHKLT